MSTKQLSLDKRLRPKLSRTCILGHPLQYRIGTNNMQGCTCKAPCRISVLGLQHGDESRRHNITVCDQTSDTIPRSNIWHYSLLRRYKAFSRANQSEDNHICALAELLKTISSLKDDHIKLANKVIETHHIREKLIFKLQYEALQSAVRLDRALIDPTLCDSYMQDQTVSLGEKWACHLMCSALEDLVSYVAVPPLCSSDTDSGSRDSIHRSFQRYPLPGDATR